jgi:hypothetical protein
MVSEMPRQAATSSDVRRSVAGFFRTDSGIARAGWQVLRVGVAIGATALGAFHAALFWDRIAAGQLFDPLVALRWVAAAGLVGALLALRHHGVSLLRGRQGLTVWTLVVLLHVGMQPAAAAPDLNQSAASDIIFVLPTTAAAALVGLGLLLASLAARRARPALTCVCTVEPHAAGRASSGWRPAGAPRAPPLQTV